MRSRLPKKCGRPTLTNSSGRSHIVAEGSLLRRAIKLDRLGSCIFWGPPGCGKTTLAHIIASTTHGNFIKMNAVQSGVADVKKAVEDARTALKLYGKRTYLLLDECHRFNKAQLDSLLPSVEQGTLVFIGSTTENPYASMTPRDRLPLPRVRVQAADRGGDPRRAGGGAHLAQGAARLQRKNGRGRALAHREPRRRGICARRTTRSSSPCSPRRPRRTGAST